MQKSKKFVLYTFNLLLIFSFIFLSSASTVSADANFSWAKGIGGAISDDFGNSIEVDSNGNVYTTGYFQDTVDFDPGADVFNLTSTGGNDIFISKFDSSGNFLWAKSMGSVNNDQGSAISVDSNGNVYTTGYFQDTVDFDPGADVFNLTSFGGSRDIFISKLDTNGNFLWAKNIGNITDEESRSISIDSNGNIYTTGFFEGTVDFDPGAGTFNLVSAGVKDIFISKLDTNGNFVWAKSMGGTDNDEVYGISIDSSGNVYTTGYFQNTVDFDPNGGTFNITTLTSGSADIFISKLDTNGNFLWAKSFGGTYSNIATSISIDSLGNVYTTGRFYETVDFDPNGGIFNLTSGIAYYDIFISKLDSSGNFVWAKSFGLESSSYPNSISVDSTGNVYTTGYFQNTVDFDPGADIFNLTSFEGSRDIFISKLDSSGNFVWAKSIGGADIDEGYGTSIDSSSNVYITGYFKDTVDFDPGAGVSNLISPGTSDIFILKLSQASLPLVSEITSIGVVVNQNTPSYTFNSNSTGTITYGGSCSSATTLATAGNNTITLNSLTAGTYSNCTITVTDGLNNVSNVLTISPFSIVVHSGGGSSTLSTPTTPVITTPVTTTETTPIQTPEPTNTNPANNNTNQNQTNLGNNKLCTPDLIITQNMKAGARDGRYHSYTKNIVKEVKILQTHMNRLGFNSGKVDGILGPITDGAIKRMQAYLKTKQDGLVGPVTRDLINNSCGDRGL